MSLSYAYEILYFYFPSIFFLPWLKLNSIALFDMCTLIMIKNLCSINFKYVDEEVYMTPPPGYCTLKKTPICHLHKLIYGPKLASHNFFFKLCSILFAEGFTQSRLITLSSNTFGVSLLLSYWFMLMTFF